MNPQHQEKINALLLLCMQVTAEGKWHCFFDYSGHVDSISIRATDSSYLWNEDNPATAIEAFKSPHIRLYTREFVDNSEVDRITRVHAELDAAIALVQGILKQEVCHAA